jgi:RNA polymerase sigma-70 factor (ECF subfamily)
MHDIWHPHSPDAKSNRADSILVTRIAQRDVHALARLYDRYSTLVYAMALRMLGNHAAAETIVMNVFAAVWKSVDIVPTAASIAPTLLAVARQQICLLHPRQIDHHQHRTHSAPLGAKGDAIQALPPEQRAIIELAYYDRLTLAEIATHLEMPLPVVTTHLREGLLTLHQSIFPARFTPHTPCEVPR